MGFYVDVRNTDYYNFYYNMVAEVNEKAVEVVKNEIPNRLMTQSAMNFRNNVLAGGLRAHHGPGEFGVMANKNMVTGEMEYVLADEMQGIAAAVQRNLAELILERAKYYCPVDTGNLVDSGHIEETDDGKCLVVFDMPYAWFVHEFTWKHHEYPTQAKFLTLACQEIETEYGFGWYKE